MFIAFWSWTGFESTVMYGEESRNPRKIIPIATLVAVTGVGLFYIFVSWMTVAGNGRAESIARAQAATRWTCSFIRPRCSPGIGLS